MFISHPHQPRSLTFDVPVQQALYTSFLLQSGDIESSIQVLCILLTDHTLRFFSDDGRDYAIKTKHSFVKLYAIDQGLVAEIGGVSQDHSLYALKHPLDTFKPVDLRYTDALFKDYVPLNVVDVLNPGLIMTSHSPSKTFQVWQIAWKETSNVLEEGHVRIGGSRKSSLSRSTSSNKISRIGLPDDLDESTGNAKPDLVFSLVSEASFASEKYYSFSLT